MNFKYTRRFLLGAALSTSALSIAQDSTAVDDIDLDFLDMDLEALMQVEVTSVSKKAERLQDVPVSLYVVSSDDIAKSGATNLHEVLMLVPGYWGVQQSYSNVTPGMRFSVGENGSIGSMLYLLDGTPIQELITAGLSWDNFDLPLEDIDRIEVIKGSGGTVYGANSATGVINIFTKDPSKYGDQVKAKFDLAYPGLYSLGVSGGTKIGKLGVAGYTKTRVFNGYGYLEEFNGDNVTVPLKDGGDTTIANQYENDFDEIIASSVGLKLDYEVSDKTKLSYRNHMNIVKRTEYVQLYNPDDFSFPQFYQNSSVNRKKVSSNRIVSNLRIDHELNENNSLFFRISNNRENDYIALGGGYEISNAIYDFELQDNITLGANSISVGANYRMLNYDVHTFNSPDQTAYVNPQADEFLWGAFVQDKIAFADGKFNLILGIKAEQFSLVSDKPYFSPQAKFSFIPSDKFTIWGGYSRAYTTPGFNQTNVELALFKAPSYDVLKESVIGDQVYQGVYDATFAQAYASTNDSTIAEQQAQAYVESDEGQAVIKEQVQKTIPSQAVKNGDASPTSFDNIELGFRTSAIKNVLFEINGYYSVIKNAIGVSRSITDIIPMQVIEDSYARYFLYGNYEQGNMFGFEAIAKAVPMKGLTVEASYSYSHTELELNDSPENLTDGLTEDQKDRTPDVPSIPEHIVRAKFSLDLPANIKLSVNSVFASIYNSRASYEYVYQRHQNIIADESNGVATEEGVAVAKNMDRYIVNFKLNKSFAEGKYNVYLFGNDVLNSGRIESTSSLDVSTMSQTRSMYGLGADLRF